jgi:hypothetical protein
MDSKTDSKITSKVAVVEGLPLDTYLDMRDTIVNLVETTKTHQEFVKDFRLSLITMIAEAEKVGLNLTAMYEYYESLDFKTIEGFEFIDTSDEDFKGHTLVIKYPADKKKTLKNIVK